MGDFRAEADERARRLHQQRQRKVEEKVEVSPPKAQIMYKDARAEQGPSESPNNL